MKLSVRLIGHAAATVAFMTAPAWAWAQQFPSRIVTILVGTPPGGPIDTTARMLGEQLAKDWGQPVIVENRPGASATIAAGALAKAPADGHTLLLSSRGITMAPALYPKLAFDTAKAFAPVAIVSEQPTLLMVSPTFPARTLHEFIKVVKANPGKYTYASTGNGSLPHLAGAMFQSLSGANIVHVPYRGAAPLMTDLTASRVDFTFASPGLGGVSSGRVVAIGNVATTRSAGYADVPTFAEAGMPTFRLETWYGLFAPAGTSPEIVKAINDKVNMVLRRPEVVAKLASLGATPGKSQPDSFNESFHADLARYGEMVRTLGLNVD